MSRRPVRVVAKEAMQKFGYDPLEVMVQFAQDPAATNDLKLNIAQTLLPYMYPKLANVTLEGEINTNVNEQSQADLFRRVMESPELADAAQKLSLAAAHAALEGDIGSGQIQ